MIPRHLQRMGARDGNSCDDQAKHLGYEEAAVKIQELYLDGKRDEATPAVPDQPVL